ncbi:MAG TPA: hypothetical protein VEU11_13935 [Terriglobales bacterium]|nr:hypothetical protein [Terriglobales bacterium]
MKSRSSKSSTIIRRKIAGLSSQRRAGTRGIALIITLILLLLLSAASVAIVLLVSSDSMINGFYRNYRGSFYASDSGVNVVVESMKNALLTAGNGAGNPPFASGAAPTSVTATVTPYQNSFYTFGDANSWRGKFIVVANPGGAPVLGTAIVTSAPNPVDRTNPADLLWTYKFPYTVTVRGESAGSEGEEVTESGTLTYSSAPGSVGAGGPPLFSDYGAFITSFTACQGPLVPGTMTGPFFTDGQWNFGNFAAPGYTFTGSIAQQNTVASWINGGSCTNSATPPAGFRVPAFPSGGLKLGAQAITPPTDSWSQVQAVLDGKGALPCTVSPCPTTTPPPTQAQMSSELQTISGSVYPASGVVPNGVYIPYYTGHGCPSASGCFGSYNTSTSTAGKAGGFFVQGNASIKLIASTTSGDLTQTYQITQSGVTTTIIVDNVNSTTTVKQGGTTLSLAGVPAQLDPNSGNPIAETNPSGAVVNPTLVYVNGSVTGLSGNWSSGAPVPAIQDNTGVTIASSGAVSITGDITYAHLPVSVPSDVAVSGTNAGVFGVYTNQNINLYPDPNGNLTVDGSLAAIGGSSGNAGFATPGGSISNWTIVGGRAEDHAHSVSIGSGNTYFDTRFKANFGPPWFPTAVPVPGAPAIPATPPQVLVTRGAWAEVGRNGNGNY